MKIIPIHLSNVPSSKRLSARVARAVAHSDLKIKFIGSLATRRGSVHWHIVNPGEKGTLELTFIPQTNELWFGIHENRKAEWIPQKMKMLSTILKS